MNLVLTIGIIIVAGFLCGLLSERFKFPRITGYILVGVLLGPSLFNVITSQSIADLNIITDIVLAVIGYLIGGSLRAKSLRGLGKSVAWVTALQSLGAWFLVTLVLAILGPILVPGGTFWQLYFPMAFIIGAISCATAPAASMAIVSQYKAKGPLTTTLLAVVALDDGIAVIAFALAVGICQPLVNGSITSLSLNQMLFSPLFHIFGSIAVGIVLAFVLIYVSKFVKTRELLLVLVFGAIMACSGISSYLDVSPILASMTVGFVVVNREQRKEMFQVMEEIEELLYVMFFVLAGLHFELAVLRTAGLLAALIIMARFVGKYGGAWIGATISHAVDSVRKYLGFALLPKAGVTIGLVIMASQEFPSFGSIMLNAVLASVIVNELFAPSLTRYAILKSGEAGIGTLPGGKALRTRV